MNKRRKEQQKWLDKLNIFDIEMVNGIVYDKLREQKKDMFKKSLACLGEDESTATDIHDQFHEAGYNQAREEIEKRLRETFK